MHHGTWGVMTSELLPRVAESLIPHELASEMQVVELRWIDPGNLLVGFSSDLSETEISELVRRLEILFNVQVTPLSMDPNDISEYHLFNVTGADAENAIAMQGIGTGSEGPIAELTSGLLERAVRLRASDIHFEPSADEFIVRARIDGKLEEISRLPESVAGAVVSRIKVLAEMNIVERRRPQDGQFRYVVGGRDIDIRVGTIATIYGEKAVTRLLDTRRTLDDVTGLGMIGNELEKFKRLIASQYGLIVVAGPTGSGKTTTLHSVIRELNKRDVNVATLEDPVEYVVEGVNHVPVVEGIGAGFATQLRGLLRQDPDVIMVGEMRDEETARIGIQAALAGRLVLTSFHATDSVSAIYRLMQMGIEPHLVAASLRGVISQRLLRRVCKYCKLEYSPERNERILLKTLIASTDDFKVARGQGCVMCRNTGYRDRVGVFQIMEMNDELRELVSLRPNPSAIYAAASASGLPTLSAQAESVVHRMETSIFEASHLVSGDV